MGKHKFKLSDMIPNAWFYKLKEMGNKGGSKQVKKPKPCNLQSYNLSPSSTPRKSHKQNQSFTPNRASYYISTRLDLDLDLDLETKKLSSPPSPKVLLVDPPRKSKRRNKRRPLKPVCSTSPSNCTTCRIRKPEPESETESNTDLVRPCCTCRVTTSPTDIIIDVADSERLVSKKLPPIITKQENNDEILKTVEKKSPPKEAFKLKTRAKSPRIATKHRKSNATKSNARKSVSDSNARKSNARKSISDNGALDGFAVVKSSSDPQKDFMESMVEMIMENKIRKTKDLEDLLACYLSLNSAEYHDVIIKVFEQIWFDFTKIRLQ